MILLEALHVSKRFGGLTAVRDLDFQLDEGTIASVIGPSGPGVLIAVTPSLSHSMPYLSKLL